MNPDRDIRQAEVELAGVRLSKLRYEVRPE
jgi:hypothetical protein